LLECSPDLEATGIRPGLPLKEAQARVPGGTYLPCDAAALDAMAAAFRAVVDALDAFSPVVEPAPPAALGEGRALAYVDVAGLELLYGTDAQLAERLAAAAEASCGDQSGVASPGTPDTSGTPTAFRGASLAARVGIAANKFTAWVAATLADRFGAAGRVMVVPAGEEATFLAPLPLETLPLPLRARLALQRLGVRTLGAYAGLPANAVAARYGTEGRRAHRLAQGLDDSPLHPRRPQPAARVEIAFEWEETELDRLTFSLKVLADQLAARLQALSSDEDAPGEPDPDFADPDPGDAFIPDPSWPEEGGDPAWPDSDDGTPLPVGEGTRLHQPPYPEAEGIGFAGTTATTRRAFLRPLPPPSAPLPKAAAPPAPRAALAVDALRVVWRLSGGREREILLRLAEPAATSAAFTEHLRWHAEGLAQFLAEEDEDDEGDESEAGATADSSSADALTYEPIERHAGVTGIVLEAVGIQAPVATQLKLLATPLQRWRDTGLRGEDPILRAREARRAIARLPARWGPDAVRQAEITTSRLPERAFRTVEPALGLQIEVAASLTPPGLPKAPPPAPPVDLYALYAPLLSQAPLWLVEPPQRVAVLPSNRTGGKPRLVELRNGVLPPGRNPGRRIVRANSAWKLVDPTLLATRDPLEREYHHVETEDGAAYLLYRDRTTDAWFIQGIFD
jgi:nucleotidyltransferase/DNA polymerase involved in DNA repair